MVGITMVERFAKTPPDNDDLDHIEQRNTQNEKGNQNCPMAGMANGVEVRKDGEHGQKVAHQMASSIAEECARTREVIGKKPKQSSKGEEGNNCDEVLPVA